MLDNEMLKGIKLLLIVLDIDFLVIIYMYS